MKAPGTGLPLANADASATLADTRRAAALEMLERIGNRWTVRVLGALESAGTIRYNEIQRRVRGISQRMLTLSLRNLERHSLVVRRHYATFPPRVDYQLTARGLELSRQLAALQAWMESSGVASPAAQERLDERKRPRQRA